MSGFPENVTVENDGMSTLAEDGSLKIIRTTVLLFFLLLSLLGNLLIIFAICVSSQRSSRPFNAYLLSLAAFGVLECSLSMPFATGFSLEGEWIFGDFLMGFNACFVQLQNVGVLLTLVAMSVDRYLATTHRMLYKRSSDIHRANYVVLYTWIHAFVISLPLLFHNDSYGLKVHGFIERGLCGLSAETTLVYTIILTVTSYGLPFFCTLGLLVALFAMFSLEKKAMKCTNTASYANYCLQETQLTAEMKYAQYVLLLFFLYLILKVPYIFVDVLTQMDVPGSYVVTVSNTTGNVTLVVEQADPNEFYYQTALTWAMFCFSAMFPLVTFAFFAEHKRRVKVHLCCSKEQEPQSRRRNARAGKRRHLHDNTNNNNRPIRDSDGYIGRRIMKRDGGKPNNKFKILGISRLGGGTANGDQKRNALHVPVLYAAADGLHLAAKKSPWKPDPTRAMQISSTVQNQENPRPNVVSGAEDGQTPQAKSAGGGSGDQELTLKDVSKELLTLNPADLPKQLKTVSPGGTNIEPVTGNGEIKSTEMHPEEATFETLSFFDQRVDVLGSSEGLQSEEENYLRCAGSDFEDETDGELNESANSRTLILPIRYAALKKKSGRVHNSISPLPFKGPVLKAATKAAQPNNVSVVVTRESSTSMPDLFCKTKVP